MYMYRVYMYISTDRLPLVIVSIHICGMQFIKLPQVSNGTRHGFLGVESFVDKAWLLNIGFSRPIMRACDLY